LSDDLTTEFRKFRHNYELFRTYGKKYNKIESINALWRISLQEKALMDEIKKESKAIKKVKDFAVIDELLHIKKKG